MAQESCNLDKDEAEILKPTSASTSPPPSSPTAAAAPPSMFLKPPPHDHPLQRSERPEMPDVTNSHTQKPFEMVEVEKEPFPPGVEISIANSGVTSCCNKRKLDEMQQKPSVGSINRCFSCQKRVGLTGFRCRCGDLFCSRHRYSNAHNCSFDYKAAGREEIAKANPVIRAAKIIKI